MARRHRVLPRRDQNQSPRTSAGLTNVWWFCGRRFRSAAPGGNSGLAPLKAAECNRSMARIKRREVPEPRRAATYTKPCAPTELSPIKLVAAQPRTAVEFAPPAPQGPPGGCTRESTTRAPRRPAREQNGAWRPDVRVNHAGGCRQGLYHGSLVAAIRRARAAGAGCPRGKRPPSMVRAAHARLIPAKNADQFWYAGSFASVSLRVASDRVTLFRGRTERQVSGILIGFNACMRKTRAGAPSSKGARRRARAGELATVPVALPCRSRCGWRCNWVPRDAGTARGCNCDGLHTVRL